MNDTEKKRRVSTGMSKWFHPNDGRYLKLTDIPPGTEYMKLSIDSAEEEDSEIQVDFFKDEVIG